MDVIRFLNPEHPMKFEQGEIINGIASKTWIERYTQAGEFKFIAPMWSGIRELLPIGSFVSHVNTTEVMIVEDHAISESRDRDPEIVVTGRGFETIFEQRIVGQNKTFPTTTGVTEYHMSSDPIPWQVMFLIQDHVLTAPLIDDDDAIPYLNVYNGVDAAEDGSAVGLDLKQKDLYSTVVELLEGSDFGMKTIRPYPGVSSSGPGYLVVLIHKGVDRSKEVTFSHDSGEIESAEYFWTNRKNKNCVLVQGRWVEIVVLDPTAVGIDRRWMVVDATDIDQKYTSAPSGGTLATITQKMQRRGATELRKQKHIALTKAEVSRQATRAIFRSDYDLGDLVSIEGNYGESSIRRVTEFVETEDKSGRTAYPTLSEP